MPDPFFIFIFHFFAPKSIYMCAGGLAGGYLHPALAWALQLHPVTETYTQNHTHVCTQKHILLLVRIFARINRGFLMPLAVVWIWNWRAGSQIWQFGARCLGRAQFYACHYLKKPQTSIYQLSNCALQIRKLLYFFTGDILNDIMFMLLFYVYFHKWIDYETGTTKLLMVLLHLFFGNIL